MPESSFELAAYPDFHASAGELVRGLAALGDDDARVRLLETVCRGLGQRLYPAFLQILLTVERFGDEIARSCIANTLVHCLVSGRLPAGALPAWGGASFGASAPFGQIRQLGPIEYVCAWYAQPSNLPTLSQAQLDTVLGALLRLVSSDVRATELYRRKLEHDAHDPLGGALSNRTREAVRELVSAWRDADGGGQDAARLAVEAYLDTLGRTSLLGEMARDPFAHLR